MWACKDLSLQTQWPHFFGPPCRYVRVCAGDYRHSSETVTSSLGQCDVRPSNRRPATLSTNTRYMHPLATKAIDDSRLHLTRPTVRNLKRRRHRKTYIQTWNYLRAGSCVNNYDVIRHCSSPQQNCYYEL